MSEIDFSRDAAFDAAASLSSTLVSDVIGDATEQNLDEFMAHGAGTTTSSSSSASRLVVDSDHHQATSSALPSSDLAWLHMISAITSSPLFSFVASVDTAGSLVREILLGSVLQLPLAEGFVADTISAASQQRYTSALRKIQGWARHLVIPAARLRKARAAKLAKGAVRDSVAQGQEQLAASTMIQACSKRCLAVIQTNAENDQLSLRREQSEALAQQQETQRAARIIQRAARMMVSRVKAASRRLGVSKCHALLVRNEATLTLQSFFRVAHARLVAKRLAMQKAEELHRTNQEGAATIIQARWRGAKGREAAGVQRVFRAANSIQRMFRGFKGRARAQRLRAEREANAVRQKLLEVVLKLQSFARMILYRRRRRVRQASMRLAAMASTLCRGYAARKLLGQARRRVIAAKKIQRAARALLARRKVNRVRRNHAIVQRQLRDYYAVLIIQRNWRIVLAKKRVAARRIELIEENAAAVKLQRFSLVVRARGRRRLLKEQQNTDREMRLISRSALLLTSVARGFLVRRRNAVRRETFANAVALIRRVAMGYVTRRYSCRAAVVYKRHLSAAIIQRKWSEVVETRLNDARRVHKLSILTGWRRQHFAAVLIQAQMRRFIYRSRYMKLKRVLHYAATKIQTRFRMVLARRVLDRLVDQLWYSACALRIQSIWLKARQRFRQRREVAELETKIRRMDWTALLRDEGIKRYAIQQDENDHFARQTTYFGLVLARLQDEYAERLDRWRAENPPQLREFAATKLQSFYRGYRTRCALDAERLVSRQAGHATNTASSEEASSGSNNRAMNELSSLKNNNNNNSDRQDLVASVSNGTRSIVSDVAVGLRLLRRISSTSSTVPLQNSVPEDEEEDVEPSSAGGGKNADGGGFSWLSWMMQFPELRSRQFERLLQREHAARRKICSDYTISCGQFALHLHSVAALHRATGASAGRISDAVESRRDMPPALAVARARQDQESLSASAAAHRVFLPPIVEERSSSLASPSAFSATYVAAALNKASGSSVDLSNLGVTHVELRPLLERLLSNSDSLESLILDGNRLTDIACADIALILIHSTKLRTLSLRYNRITDTGISHIIAAASRSPSLEVLDVAGTLVTERYRSHILRLLSAPRTTLGLSNARRTGVITGAAGDEEMPLVAARTVAPPPSVAHLAPSRQPAAVIPPYRLLKVEMVMRQTKGGLEEEDVY